MEFKDAVKELRIKKGLSQEELGQLVGLKKAAINKYETGVVINPKRSLIEKLAAVLDTTPSYLMGWNESVKDYFDELERKMISFDFFIRKFENYESVYDLDGKHVNITIKSEPNILYKVPVELYDDFMQLVPDRIDAEFKTLLKRSKKIIINDSSEVSKSHLEPVAAHNDDNSPEQIELMKKDLKDL